jgi:hypothetical protein
MSKDSAEIGDNSDFEVNSEDLDKILSELGSMKKTVSEANGKLRSRLKQILDEKGYHPKALAMVRQIDDMSETYRADFLRTFRPMFDAMMEGKWDGESADLLSELDQKSQSA